MEGACGKILETDDPKIVIKKIHRRNRAQQRRSSNGAEKQASIQEWARKVCEAGCKLLFVPRAFEAEKFQYKMERIDVTQPLELQHIAQHPVISDLQIFYRQAKEDFIFPADFELYIQPDGRIAMVDFDKFATWLDDSTVQFPWGVTASVSYLQQSVPFQI